jgi:phosphatidylserine synthase 2
MVASSPSRFLESSLVVGLILLFDLNVFFLKYALWVPPRNPLNTYRLVLWFLCALPAVREYYEYLQGNTGGGGSGRFRKLGAFAWLAAAVSGLESACSFEVICSCTVCQKVVLSLHVMLVLWALLPRKSVGLL